MQAIRRSNGIDRDGDQADESELETDLRDVLARVRDGARVVVERDGTAIAVIVPPTSDPPRGITGRELAARLRGLRMPGDGFADDIESTRAAVVPGVTLREIIERVGDLEMPGDGYADDLEAVHNSQGRVTIPEWPD